jgi:Fe-S oxidoreductase
MATYKAEVLYHAYRHRIRPASHYSLGWLPRWARLASKVPRPVNAALETSMLRRFAQSAAGVDRRRTLPRFARRTFRSSFNETRGRSVQFGEPVLLFVDTFTNYFAPEVGEAMVAVLESAGYSPQLTQRQECCALTWISTGQLDAAKRILRRTVDALAQPAAEGMPIVGIEPSCTAVLRSDARELLGSSAFGVVDATRTLAELLVDRDWSPPALDGLWVVAQPHCHHHAVMGWDADATLLARAGARVDRLGGCCGLAGNFGVEKGHYDVSVAVANQQLMPAVTAADHGTVVLADGFSCRTQLSDLAGTRGRHLAELIADNLSGRRGL